MTEVVRRFECKRQGLIQRIISHSISLIFSALISLIFSASIFLIFFIIFTLISLLLLMTLINLNTSLKGCFRVISKSCTVVSNLSDLIYSGYQIIRSCILCRAENITLKLSVKVLSCLNKYFITDYVSSSFILQHDLNILIYKVKISCIFYNVMLLMHLIQSQCRRKSVLNSEFVNKDDMLSVYKTLSVRVKINELLHD